MSLQEMIEYQLKARGITDKRVLSAIAKVDRRFFLPPSARDQAYEDHPVPIGHGQTISQPYIVALMTELLHLTGREKVLEVGTGSGYQTAILAELASSVWSIEFIPELVQRAVGILKELGYTNVHLLQGDGALGWEEEAPYDAILSACAPDKIPPPLLSQLADGGRMVIPVGPSLLEQTLWLVEKKGEKLEYHNKGGVLFVPMLHK